MANGNKQYAKWLDIPDGSGGKERKWLKDEEARSQLSEVIPNTYATKTELSDATLIPVNINTLTPSSTFVKNAVIGINGVLYRATQNTSNMPCTLITSGGSFVVDIINGKISFVVSDPTPNSGWEIWTDAAVEYWIAQLNALIATKATIADVMAATVSYGQTQFTVLSLLQELAKIVSKTIVISG